MKLFRLILLALGISLAHSSTAQPEPAMKEVVYRGGLVRFEIPNDWIEEYEEEGGGTFYEDGPDTGTLRLSLITAESPTDLDDDASIELLEGSDNINPQSIRRLANGNAIGNWVEHSSEDGVPITLFWWHISNPVPPRHVRLAMFSYTVLSSQERDPKTVAEGKMLEGAIERAEFYPGLGELRD